MRLSAGHLEEEATRSCGRTVWVYALSHFLKLERTLVSTSTKVKLHAAHTQSHESAERHVIQMKPVWRTINTHTHTHRKLARLGANTGHTSSNKTSQIFFYQPSKPLCVSCAGPRPQLYSVAAVVIWSCCFAHEDQTFFIII